MRDSVFDVRVAFLTNFVAPYRAPLYRALKNKVREFKLFISTPMENNRLWSVNHQGLDVVHQKTWTIETKKWRYGSFGEFAYIHFPYDTYSQLKRYQPDVVISAELGLRTIIACLFCKTNGCLFVPWLSLSEGTESDVQPWRTWIRRQLLSRADWVVPNGVSAARYVRGITSPDVPIHVAPFTVDPALFSMASENKDPDRWRRLLYVGRLITLKGLLPFLEVAIEWCRKHPTEKREMWFLGDGPLIETLRNMSSPPNLTIRVLGNVPYEELAEVYAQCGILCLPTYKDTWGMVVSEAFASGLAILGSDHAQAVEHLVEERINGWRFKPENNESMVSAVNRALSADVTEIASIGRRNRQRALSLTPSFSADCTLEGLVQKNFNEERRSA